MNRMCSVLFLALFVVACSKHNRVDQADESPTPSAAQTASDVSKPGPPNAQTVAHTVLLTWYPFPTSTPTNPGVYNISRCQVGADGSCTFKYLNFVKQTFDANNVAINPQYVDAAVSPGAIYQYEVTFKYTPSGTATSIETDPSDPVSITIPLT